MLYFFSACVDIRNAISSGITGGTGSNHSIENIAGKAFHPLLGNTPIISLYIKILHPIEVTGQFAGLTRAFKHVLGKLRPSSRKGQKCYVFSTT